LEGLRGVNVDLVDGERHTPGIGAEGRVLLPEGAPELADGRRAGQIAFEGGGPETLPENREETQPDPHRPISFAM
jgi:hypothetical protein